MDLKVIRTGASKQLIDRLERASGRLVSRVGEEWTLALEAGAGGLTLVACGPGRAKVPAEWVGQAQEGSDRWRYRRTLAATLERSIEGIDQIVRDLVWQPFVVAPHPLRALDPALAGAFEATVLEALRFEPAEPLVIRFGLWDGDESGPRYVCKVESLPVAGFDTPAAWRWWSPLVATPAELSHHVGEALRSRRPPRARVEVNTREEFWGWGAAGHARA